ncbi:MAG TPA: class I SAM-dependent methyltransferase [Bryobacteraceae bacterium]|nr:class I SAM-dependent methyltransferase [Bryobacteraceae bacterium]
MKLQAAVPRLTYNLEDQERMSRAKNYFAWQSRLVLPELGQRVVEIGCGIGNFTQNLLDRESIVAIDIEAGCIERLRQRFPGQPNLHAFVREAGAGLDDLKTFRPDSVICLNVLEHIGDDDATLRNMAAILPPGGAIVLIVPAFQALHGPIDRNLGHHRRYSRESISRMAADSGLHVRKMHYINFPGFFGWWMNAHILRREAQSAAQIEVFDRWIVPVISRVESVVHPPFGQSLFCVLEVKPVQ